MRHAPARPEQPSFPQNLTYIVNEALRAAALAPTYQDALDITGDALRLLAEMSANNPGAIRRAHSAEYSYTVSGGRHA
ncbi:hypothetical protein [Paraburkholderia sp. MM6662-R1]|uniref:hypothetical protein n=1 Tax=Paraburkholderia sp. MM6662-R1 TaxID=2991066 RepID=UPI003D24074C